MAKNTEKALSINVVNSIAQALEKATYNQLATIARAYKDMRLQVNAMAFYRAIKLALHNRDVSGLAAWIAEFKPSQTDIARACIVAGGYTLVQTAKGTERLYAPEKSVLSYDSTTKAFAIREVDKQTLEKAKATLESMEYACIRPDQIPVMREIKNNIKTIDVTASSINDVFIALNSAE